MIIVSRGGIPVVVAVAVEPVMGLQYTVVAGLVVERWSGIKLGMGVQEGSRR